MVFAETGRTPTVQLPVRATSYTLPQLTEYTGKYYCPELDTTYTVMPQDGKLLLRAGHWGDFLLSPRFADSFANPAEMGSIMFTRDRKNNVAGFVVRSGKVRNLYFNKTKHSDI